MIVIVEKELVARKRFKVVIPDKAVAEDVVYEEVYNGPRHEEIPGSLEFDKDCVTLTIEDEAENVLWERTLE